MEEAGRGRWKKFTAEAGRSSPRWVEEVERGTQLMSVAIGQRLHLMVLMWVAGILR